MLKKFLLIAGFIGCFNLLCTANLLKNGEFNAKNVGCISAKKGTYKLSRYTESDGNKCAKLELIKFEQGEKGKKTNIQLHIGDDKTKLGFQVKPDTKYKFSLMLKGNQARTGIKAEEIHALVTPLWKSKRVKVKIDFSVPVKVEPDKWNRVEGTFTTSKKAKRACITVMFWWDEKYGPTMFKKGDYVLIDKVVVEEAPDKLAALTSSKTSPKPPVVTREKIVQISQLSSSPLIDGKLNEDCWKEVPAQGNFIKLGAEKKASVKSQFKIFRNGENIYLGVKCFEPDMNQLKAAISRNGTSIWKDDVVEVFFSPALESVFLQFAVSAGGGHYIGDGAKELDPLYKQWNARVHKDKNYWSIEFKIPYKLMWDKIKENSIEFRLNVCRQRKQAKELSTWSPMTVSFHRVNEFGRIFFGNIKKWTKVKITDLQKEIKALPESAGKNLTKQLNKLNTANIGNLYNQIKTIEEKIKFLKLAGRKFVVTEVARHRGTRVPLLPEQLSNPPQKISLTASVNEVRSIPLAITNLTDKTAEYQILLCSEKINRADEKPGLKSNSARFPINKIKCLRAIRIKESDETGTSVRFDPLVEVDRSYTVTASSKDSALFYYKFDCNGIKPGIYKGFLHVIPLSEPTLFQSPLELPQIQSIPFELNVLAIKLSRNLRAPMWYFGAAKDKKVVQRMLDEGITYFPISIYGMIPKFDDKGNVISNDDSLILKYIAQQRKWAAEYKPGVKIKHVVTYSLYQNFMKRFAKKRFKVDSPEWRNGFKNWTKLFVKVRNKAGLKPSEFIVELEDEPAHNKSSTPYSVALEACKMTKEVAPDLMTMLTYSARLEAKDLHQFIPYIDVCNFSEQLMNRKGYPELVKELRKLDRQIWIYRCNKGINSDLYSYYRLHAWYGENYNADVVAFWPAYGTPKGIPSSWRNVSDGNYLVLYGDVFSSVRNECFINGFNDLKYYDKLEKVTKHAKARGKNSSLVRKAEKLLREAPGKITGNRNDFRQADRFRHEAINLILKLQK